MPSPSTLVALLVTAVERRPHAEAFRLSLDGERDGEVISYGELERRAKVLAGRLLQTGRPGDRVLLVSPEIATHVTSMFGCLYAGMIPVSGIPPSAPRAGAAADRQARKLAKFIDVIRTTGAKAILAPSRLAEAFGRAALAGGREFALDLVPIEDLAASHQDLVVGPSPQAQDLALLQYTSGSTGKAKAIALSHENLIANLEMQNRVLRTTQEDIYLTWLPPHHDMGLIGTGLVPLYGGFPSIVMSPTHFAEEPTRWLKAIDRHKATLSAAPNFAYDLCAKQAAKVVDIDLSHWRTAVNGAEPIVAEIVDRFVSVFLARGFNRDAICPSYGLAEATLHVTGAPSAGLVMISFDKVELALGRALRTEGDVGCGGVKLVSCGPPAPGLEVIIVDPEARTRLPDGYVGEVWCRGASIACGYYEEPAETATTFGALLDDGQGPYLRTGDLAFMLSGELFFVSRLKDLIIIRGVNHFPQDIEAAARASHEAWQADACAAFAVERDGTERIVVVAEIRRGLEDMADEALAALAFAVSNECEVQVYAARAIRQGSIFKTSSGKIQRNQCGEAFDAGKLDVVAAWDSFGAVPDQAPPSGPVELRLADICCQVLGWKTVGRYQDLMAAGADSISSFKVLGRIRDEFGVDLSIRSVFEASTVQSLAVLVDQALEKLVDGMSDEEVELMLSRQVHGVD